MKVVVTATPNMFQILEVVDCPAEFKAGNGWRVQHFNGPVVLYEMTGIINLDGTNSCIVEKENVLPALTALHEMVYQPQSVFEDDGQTVTMTHGKFRIEEWAGGQIVFQVLEMDEEFRQMDNEHGGVVSRNFPQISEEIYLRGLSRTNDFIITVSAFKTRPQIISALRDWDQNWPGWNNNIPTLEQCCKYGSLEKGGLFVFESEVKNG